MGCNVQDWSLKDLTDALNNKHIDKKRIVVPIFQRGTRWKREQEETFIDSLRKGFPVGTMLFYETIEDNQSVYLLVDGLQRGNTIRKYITKPTEFFSSETINDRICGDLLAAMGVVHSAANVAKTRSELTQFIKSQDSYANLQFLNPAVALLKSFDKKSDVELIQEKMIPLLQEYFKERQNRYLQIAQTIIPVVVYQGEMTDLDEIFKRINSQGTPLDQYEMYAAAWPSERNCHVDNPDVINAVVMKYESMEKDDFEIHGYDRQTIKDEKALTAFEYLFGLSKVLTQKVSVFHFIAKGETPDMVNTLAFELVSACLNDSNKIHELYKRIAEIPDVNQFEKALKNAISFVQDAIAPITKFKGNNRKMDKILHSRYQIISLVSTTFKEMYSNGDYSKFDEEWTAKKRELARNLQLYYVFDILTNHWREGGVGKIYAAARPNRYRKEITAKAWNAALDEYFEKTMRRTERTSVKSPNNEEFVFLNCIYLHTFKAIDQLDAAKFDVEHLAPKGQLKKLIDRCDGEGLAVSSIANLCYLPEAANRSKGALTIYQDKKYLKGKDIKEIEDRFSFTKEEDLEWMDLEFKKKEFYLLKEWYDSFCTTRFKTLKQKFCEAMNIEIVDGVVDSDNGNAAIPVPSNPNPGAQSKSNEKLRPIEKAIEYLNSRRPELRLTKKTPRACVDADGVGYYFAYATPGKKSKKSNDRLYWYSYRKEPLAVLDGCTKIVLCYVMADDGRIIFLPQSEIESRTGKGGLSHSTNENGTTYWHIKFIRDIWDNITWLASGAEGSGEKMIVKDIV